ncbi:hypothetical protein Mycsm_05798 [Mycobacterium sp. JS623]|nr:hypothetical protein Mycsm_05798 [Mycobacterium sp. JS623]
MVWEPLLVLWRKAGNFGAGVYALNPARVRPTVKRECFSQNAVRCNDFATSRSGVGQYSGCGVDGQPGALGLTMTINSGERFARPF